MNKADADLHSADLSAVLRALPPEASERTARLIVAMRDGVSQPFDSQLRRSVAERKLRGHDLVHDIERELRWLARHPPSSAPTYREILQILAHRHEVEDDGTRAPASVERDLLRRYGDQPRPVPETFQDQGSWPLIQKIGFFVPGPGWVAWAVAPDWRTVTAATLEIATHRRIALTRQFRSSLED